MASSGLMESARVFRAASMPEALALVKKELGPEAIILGTRALPAGGIKGLVGRERVEITASRGPAHRTPSRAATVRERVQPIAEHSLPYGRGSESHKNPLPHDRGSDERGESRTQLPPAIRPHYENLVRAEVEAELAERIIQSAMRPGEPLNPARVQAALRGAIASLVPSVGGIELKPGTARRVALIGPPGVGKTTTIAKLAAHFKLKAKCNVALLSIDTYRPAAHDQLKRYAELIGVPVYQAQTGSGVRAALKEIGNVDLVLIDTPGVGGRDRGRFARLAALLRAARPDELHLALSASLAQKVQEETIRTFSPLGPTRLLLTRLDEAVGLGAILGVIRRVDWQMSYLTSGQRVPSDIEEFRHERLAEMIVASTPH